MALFGYVTEYYRHKQFSDVQYCIAFDINHYMELNSHPKIKDEERRYHFENNNLDFDRFYLFDVMIHVSNGEPLENPKAEIKLKGDN